MFGIYIITNLTNNKVYIGQVGKGKNKTFMTRKKLSESHKGNKQSEETKKKISETMKKKKLAEI